MALRYQKGDLVIVNVAGNPKEYEILSHLVSNRNLKVKSDSDLCYEARDISSGETKTIYEDEILRPATPVDNSARLFQRQQE